MSLIWRSVAERWRSLLSYGERTASQPPGRWPRVDTTTRFTVESADEGRLDSLLARHLDLSRTQAATLIANGRVRVDARAEKASFRPERGALVVVQVPVEPAARTITPEDIPLSVLYEDEELLVVDKPAGMVVHPAPGNWTGTLVNALRGRGQALAESADAGRAGLVHRLDKDTSGLIVVAKTERAHRVLGKAIADRRVSRRYAALSWGHLSGDRLTVDRPIARDAGDRKACPAKNLDLQCIARDHWRGPVIHVKRN